MASFFQKATKRDPSKFAKKAASHFRSYAPVAVATGAGKAVAKGLDRLDNSSARRRKTAKRVLSNMAKGYGTKAIKNRSK